ncbi:P-loop containing nucleoside triphosphate hydrolase protein [Serendipita vermifera]|nr:P-loop containing nucleoside triphosphate hydrolase protein [Serendipita vermifera]
MLKPIQKRVVVLGDGLVGKTALVRTLHVPEFILDPHNFLPRYLRYFMQYVKTEQGQTVDLGVWDLSPREDYEQTRDLSYPFVDVVVICFAVDDRESFEHAEHKWLPEIQYFRPGIPVVLVACKIDLRMDVDPIKEMEKRGQITVSLEEGEAMARRMGAKAYIECSTRIRTNVEEVFQKAASVAVSSPQSKSSREQCRIF